MRRYLAGLVLGILVSTALSLSGQITGGGASGATVTCPGGSGTELLYRTGASSCGTVTGTSFSGGVFTVPDLTVNNEIRGVAVAGASYASLGIDAAFDNGGGNVDGGGFSIVGGTGTGTGGGGSVSISGGQATANGGGVSIIGGSSSAGSVGQVNVQGGSPSGVNREGGNMQISGGNSTGNANGGSIIFATAVPGASGEDFNFATARGTMLGTDFEWKGTYSLGAAGDGVRFSAADGVLTLLGLGNGNDENLTLDFDNAAANEINIGTGTGVTVLDFGTITLEADYNSSDGTAGLTQTCSAAVTAVTVKDGLITAITCP